jgi:hypothetical protein
MAEEDSCLWESSPVAFRIFSGALAVPVISMFG